MCDVFCVHFHVWAYPCMGEQEPQSVYAGTLSVGPHLPPRLGQGLLFLCFQGSFRLHLLSGFRSAVITDVCMCSSCILGIQAQVFTLPQWIIYSLSWIPGVLIEEHPQLYQHHRVKQSPGWCFWCNSRREWDMSQEGEGRCLRAWHLVYPLDSESFLLTGVD